MLQINDDKVNVTEFLKRVHEVNSFMHSLSTATDPEIEFICRQYGIRYVGNLEQIVRQLTAKINEEKRAKIAQNEPENEPKAAQISVQNEPENEPKTLENKAPTKLVISTEKAEK